MENTYVWLINCRLRLFRSSASSFSSLYLLLFLKQIEAVLPTPFTSVICPSMALWRRQFIFEIWQIQLDFLRRILFRSVIFSPIWPRLFSIIIVNNFLDLFPYVFCVILNLNFNHSHWQWLHNEENLKDYWSFVKSLENSLKSMTKIKEREREREREREK